MNRFQFEKPSLTQKEEAKFRKKELKRLRKKMLLFCFLPVLFVSWLLFNNDISKYKLLKEKGVKADAISTFIPIGSYKYFFVTPEGIRVDKKGKCHNLDNFNKKYNNLMVIYDPTNPSVFMEFPDIENYFIPGKIFFYFVVMNTMFNALLTLLLAEMKYYSKDDHDFGISKFTEE